MRGRMSSRKDPRSQDVYPWGIVPACRGGILPCADNAPGYTHRICGDRCAPWRCAPNVGSHRASYVHWHLLGFSAGPPSAVRLMLRARHISSRVRRHTCKCRAHGQACTSFHGTPPPILPRICSRTAGGFLSVPPGRGDTRPKQSAASRFPCEGDDTRVEPRRRPEGGTSLDEQNSHLGRWPPLHHGDRLSGPPSDSHLGIGTPCGCTLLPPQLRRTPRAMMRSSRRLLSRSPRGLMRTNSSGARASFSSW